MIRNTKKVEKIKRLRFPFDISVYVEILTKDIFKLFFETDYL